MTVIMEIIRFLEAKSMDPVTESHQSYIRSIKYAAPLHTHDFYEFFLITNGSTVHVINGQKQLLSEGSMVFIRPSDIHAYEYYKDSDCQFINIPYTTSAINEVFSYLGDAFDPHRLLCPSLSPHTVLSPLEKENLINRFNKIYIFYENNKPQVRIQLRSMLVEILTQYFPAAHNDEHANFPLWFESLLTQMQKKENFTEGIGKMFELSGRSIGHINRVFRSCLNTTPTEYVNKLRLHYAKHLLQTTHYSIVEIALESGFNNLSHFYHLFRKTFRIAPGSFR